MKKVFTIKGVITPEEYLKNMLDCIDENGELNIAREFGKEFFCTAESENSEFTERVKLDVALADYDSIYSFYNNALSNLDLFIAENSLECNDKPYRNIVLMFAKRIKSLIELKAPSIVLQAEKCMLIDCIVLYKMNADGEFIVNIK